MSKRNKKQIIPVNEKSKSILKNKALSQKSIFKKKELDFKIVVTVGFLLSLLFLIFCYNYFGSYFEMNDDPRYVMAMKGFASPLPYNNFVSVYKFTIYIYIFLYKHFPNIGWYGLSMFLLLWGSLFNIYITLYLVAKNRINYFLFLVLFIGFCFLIFFQNVYWINFTRPSILVSSSFIILLTVLYVNIETLKKYKWVLAFPIFTYILGHLTRLDAGYLGFTFGLAFSALYIIKQKPIFPFLLKFIAPVICFIIFIKVADIFSQKNNARNQDFLEKTEIIRQLIDYRNVASYIPKDAKDSISYDAMMTARYCSDDKIISIDFLKNLTKESPLLSGGDKNKFTDEFGAFSKSLQSENSLAMRINISLLAILIIWLLVSVKNNYLIFLKYLLFQLFFMGLVVGMSYYMKLPARIFNPILVMLTIGNVIFIFNFFYFRNRQFYYILFFPCFFILAGISKYADSNNKLITNYKQYGQINQMMINDMNNSFNNTIFIPTNLRSWEMHNATDPIKEINFKNKNCYVYLTIELSLAPETQDQLLDKFGTYDHSILFKKISTMSNVVFISDDNFNNFLKAYYHFIYNQDYEFEKINATPPPFYQFTGLNYYRLKSFPND